MRFTFWLLILPAIMGTAFSGGCAVATPASPSAETAQPRYVIDVFPVHPPVVTTDGFDTGLKFSIAAEAVLSQTHLVQELHQVMTYEFTDGSETRDAFSLVECFRLREVGKSPLGVRYELEQGQVDRHFQRGLRELGANIKAVRIERTVTAYLAAVRGADFTRRGFAQLEANEDGSVQTNSPDQFNEAYRNKHATRGRPVASNHAGAVTYRIDYRLARTGMGHADFALSRERGYGRVFQPSVVLRP